MRSLALAVALALPLVGTACSSGVTGHADQPRSTAASTASGPAAVTAAGHVGAVTYCSAPDRGRGPTDYLWSGVQVRARQDATVERVTARASGVRIVGSWVVEDAQDDGELAPWGHAGRLTPAAGRAPAEGAELTGGTTYRLVLRLRPRVGAPTRIDDIGIDWSSTDTTGSLVDPSTLQFGGHCS